MFLVNSRSHLVTATLSSLRSKSDHRKGHTFSRSYGAILPSSFTRVLSSALGFSPHPPVSVWGTVLHYLKLRGFTWKHGINYFAQKRARHRISVIVSRICLRDLPTCLNRHIQQPADLAFSVPPSHRTRYRNINLFPIDYGSRPRLRGRLTLLRLALSRKPWVFGVRVFHPHYRYSCQHSHF